MVDDDAVSRLGELLLARAAQWSSASLAELPAAATRPWQPDRELAAHVLEHRGAIAAWLAAALREPAGPATWEHRPALALREQLTRWLHHRQQFLQLDAAALAELEALARRALEGGLRALVSADEEALLAGLRDAVAGLRAGLSGFVRARLGPRPREVVSAEYSPALQLEVLGLTLAQLPAPVLDVGCGPEAPLVTALRAAGVQAEGIDRAASGPMAADWLTYAYGEDRWGAVLSHLGFSLHFLHHHLAGGPTAFAYARVYMAILRSLRPGGLFAYAPGLPFLEGMLPRDRYRVVQVPLPPSLQTPALLAMQEDTGVALGHATQVHRVG